MIRFLKKLAFISDFQRPGPARAAAARNRSQMLEVEW